MDILSDKEINEIILDIFKGVITVEQLPVNLYLAIADKLLSAFDNIEGVPSDALLKELSENIYIFSGAKVYQQINDISLLSEQGGIKSYSDFRDEALKIYDQYNGWLETEYNTAIANAQQAVRWEQIEDQKKTLPFLKYSAVMDDNTSEICVALDGICLSVEDPFWNTNSPTNHWNCRCLIEQLDAEDAASQITPQSEANKVSEDLNDKRQPMFNNNPGKDKEIFSKESPYFSNVPKDLAKVNFNLPIPDEE
tara:strand:- start:71 stop:826 length:756 start_codon:yes stop_codon:yes gene_type:complete